MGTVKKLFALDEDIARELDIVASVLHKSQKEVVETALDFYFDYTDRINGFCWSDGKCLLFFLHITSRWKVGGERVTALDWSKWKGDDQWTAG